MYSKCTDCRIKILTDDQVDNLTWEQKSTWLHSNPVTAARHFDHRLQLFMTTLIHGKSKPIGEIQDYNYRIEFQQRGSPHCHMLLWVRDAPSISESSPSDVSTFIDKYISCTVPDNNNQLSSLVQTVQRHSNSDSDMQRNMVPNVDSLFLSHQYQKQVYFYHQKIM